MRCAVTVSLVPQARGGPFVFWDGLDDACRSAAELGFDALEIFPPAADSIAPDRVRPLLERHGLKLAAVGSGGGWLLHRLTLTSPDPAIRAQARQFIRSLIDAAGTLGAPTIVGSMQGRFGDGTTRDSAMQYLVEALNELGEHARRYNVPLLYEPLNRYETNMICTLADGVALLQSLKTRNVKLLADLFHMNIEEPDLAASIGAASGGALGHVHLADSNRRPAGCGHTDFGSVARVLRDIGYDGYISAECLPWPDSMAAAGRTIAACHKYFSSEP